LLADVAGHCLGLFHRLIGGGAEASCCSAAAYGFNPYAADPASVDLPFALLLLRKTWQLRTSAAARVPPLRSFLPRTIGENVNTTETVKPLKYPAMRSFLIAILGLLFFSGIGTCADTDAPAPDSDAPALAHPDLIIVRRFAAPTRPVALDPSLGFSLDRRQPGVPAARRAASLARATAFVLAETITEQLRALGYHAVQSDEAGPEPDGRALIVSGSFRSINEGHRRRFAAKDASVAASVEIASQSDGARPQRLLVSPLDSRQIPQKSRERRELGVKSAARQLGLLIADAVADLAQRNNWRRAPL